MNKINREQKNKKEIHKPFITGDVTDESTLKRSLFFFGSLIVVILVAFIACASASFSNLLLRLLLNLAVIALGLMIFFNNGSRHGTEAVTRGEILYQKKDKGQEISESEKKMCFHPAKGFVTALIGTAPFLVLAVILALNTSVQMTDSGTLPSWMQAYTRRSDIGNALINYTEPEGMTFIDFVRMIIRICIIPFVNIVSYSDKNGMCLLERLSPIVLLLPAAAYGSGYLTGKSIRTKIHTAISENDKRRIRKERKKKTNRNNSGHRRETEQLN